MAALETDVRLQLRLQQQREARAEAAERRRAAAARQAFEDVREMEYTEVEAAIEAGGGETVGEGAYGPVYAARLSDGQDVAIKVCVWEEKFGHYRTLHASRPPPQLV